MGGSGASKHKHVHTNSEYAHKHVEHKSSTSKITDRFHTVEALQEGLRESGLESSSLVLAIDFTKSNTWTGRSSFGGKCLHAISPDCLNPYQQAILLIARTLEPFDDDHLIPCFGFGDATTTDKSCFAFLPDRYCKGVQEVQDMYTQMAGQVALSGPTNFAPVIRATLEIVKQARAYHILVIIADGQVTNEEENRRAIIEASEYPLSIIMVGVGDGPWETMIKFDDGIHGRKFDNFQFVPFSAAVDGKLVSEAEMTFLIHALQEIPDQFKEIKKLGLL